MQVPRFQFCSRLINRNRNCQFNIVFLYQMVCKSGHTNCDGRSQLSLMYVYLLVPLMKLHHTYKSVTGLSHHLGQVEFQFVLLTDTPYSPMPPDVNDDVSCPDKTVVAVEVKDKRNGAIHHWSVPKLLYVNNQVLKYLFRIFKFLLGSA